MAAALAKDPAIRTAALAGLNGHGDFMALLALPPGDWEIAVAVLIEQQRIRHLRGETG